MAPVMNSRPMLSIQCDWDEVLGSTTDSDVWVSCKKFGSASKHGKIKYNIQGGNGSQFSIEGSFKVESFSKKSIVLLHEDPKCKCAFYPPEKVFSAIHQKNIVSMDVTLKGLGVSACAENKLLIWDTENGSVLRTLVGHKWDVYKCGFFPSGLVVLSTGADMQMKIWSAETGKCPVTLTGHTAAVTDTAIIDRGRNILSVSKDGSAKLWDCGESACLDTFFNSEGNINCCSVSNVDINVGQPDSHPSEREVGTGGKLFIAGCENGTLHCVGLQSRKKICEYLCKSAVNCCCFVSKSLIACGTQDGKVYLFDLNNCSEAKEVWEESASPCLCVLPTKSGFFISKGDGTCIFTSLSSNLALQLTGPGFDPVYCMASDGKAVFTGCRDGLIRRYVLPNDVAAIL